MRWRNALGMVLVLSGCSLVPHDRWTPPMLYETSSHKVPGSPSNVAECIRKHARVARAPWAVDMQPAYGWDHVTVRIDDAATHDNAGWVFTRPYGSGSLAVVSVHKSLPADQMKLIRELTKGC